MGVRALSSVCVATGRRWRWRWRGGFCEQGGRALSVPRLFLLPASSSSRAPTSLPLCYTTKSLPLCEQLRISREKNNTQPSRWRNHWSCCSSRWSRPPSCPEVSPFFPTQGGSAREVAVTRSGRFLRWTCRESERRRVGRKSFRRKLTPHLPALDTPPCLPRRLFFFSGPGLSP